MKISKRKLLFGIGAVLTASAIGVGLNRRMPAPGVRGGHFVGGRESEAQGQGMKLRDFGATGMRVSEVGFGAWGIGGAAYGSVQRQESLDALARAEELGCNLVDTAAVYGDSEAILGEFLRGRRSRWLISTKYSAQPEGMERTIEAQLKRLGTDVIDFYMVHWAPGRGEDELYEQLYKLKKSGKARAVGVSLKSAGDIDHVLDDTDIDGFMVRFSLLDPDPFVSRLHRIRERKPAIIVRSALKEGFLTGKYKHGVVFDDEKDQRSTWTREQVDAVIDAVERFRFLEQESGSMVAAAARYPLSFPEVSTVIMGTKSVAHADSNFGQVPGLVLSDENLQRIYDLQLDMGLRSKRELLMGRIRALFGRDH
jgi:aryl-alcohol dehydrogenase-like predicted oxidoreductase